jgi:hypothetical protein
VPACVRRAASVPSKGPRAAGPIQLSQPCERFFAWAIDPQAPASHCKAVIGRADVAPGALRRLPLRLLGSVRQRRHRRCAAPKPGAEQRAGPAPKLARSGDPGLAPMGRSLPVTVHSSATFCDTSKLLQSNAVVQIPRCRPLGSAYRGIGCLPQSSYKALER